MIVMLILQRDIIAVIGLLFIPSESHRLFGDMIKSIDPEDFLSFSMATTSLDWNGKLHESAKKTECTPFSPRANVWSESMAVKA